jgi:hypothetical protein
MLILKLRLNQHSGKAYVADGGLAVGLSAADLYESGSSDYLLVCFKNKWMKWIRIFTVLEWLVAFPVRLSPIQTGKTKPGMLGLFYCKL